MFKRSKRFFLNSEGTYSSRELVVNWGIWISVFLVFIFSILFSVFTKDVHISSFQEAMNSKMSDTAISFSLVVFTFLIILIALGIIKFMMRRKRKKIKAING